MKTITKKGYFAAAHHIPNHDGKCKNVHGHTWLFKICITGDTKEGMVFDFGIVKDIMMQFDHQDINDFLPMPTCENIADYLAHDILNKCENAYSVSLELWESPDSSCIVSCTKDPGIAEQLKQEMDKLRKG